MGAVLSYGYSHPYYITGEIAIEELAQARLHAISQLDAELAALAGGMDASVIRPYLHDLDAGATYAKRAIETSERPAQVAEEWIQNLRFLRERYFKRAHNE